MVQGIDDAQGTFDRRTIEPGEVVQWLQEDDAVTGFSWASSKLLLVKTHSLDAPNPLSVERRKRDMEEARDFLLAAELPLAGLTAFAYSSDTFAKAPLILKQQDEHISTISRYYSVLGYWSLTWAHVHRTRTTKGVLICSSVLDNCYEWFLETLSANRQYADLPMFVAFVGAQTYFQHIKDWYANAERNVQRIKEQLGLFQWDPRSGSPPATTAQPGDYGELSKHLSSASGSFNLLRLRLRILEELTVLIRYQHGISCQGANNPQKERTTAKVEELRYAIEVLAQHEKVWLHKSGRLIDELSNLMSATYNLIAQKDSKVGLRIARSSHILAEESKKDNSSMKTIAAVTMAFLPGTFVASFFAMPMFDWYAPPGQNVKSTNFWIYWAVTIPLTISVFLIWGLWFQYKTAKEKRKGNAGKVIFQTQNASERSAGTENIGFADV